MQMLRKAVPSSQTNIGMLAIFVLTFLAVGGATFAVAYLIFAVSGWFTLLLPCLLGIYGIGFWLAKHLEIPSKGKGGD